MSAEKDRSRPGKAARNVTDGDTLLTSADACEALSIDRSTLSRWVQLGRIAPAMKAPGIRGAMFFTPDEVERVKTEVAA